MPMRALFEKVKQAAGSIPNNEDELLRPVRVELPHTCSDPSAVMREGNEERSKLLKRIFADTAATSASDKQRLATLFAKFRNTTTTSRNALLQKEARVPPPTLSEAVRRIR